MLRQVDTVTSVLSGKFAKVYRDPEFGEYRVRFYSAQGKTDPAEDYFTSDPDDAKATARVVVWGFPVAEGGN